MIVICLKQLSTIFQLYHGVSSISHQYYSSIYPDNSQSVVIVSPQPGPKSICYDPTGDCSLASRFRGGISALTQYSLHLPSTCNFILDTYFDKTTRTTAPLVYMQIYVHCTDNIKMQLKCTWMSVSSDDKCQGFLA